jgi:hypothetical protein
VSLNFSAFPTTVVTAQSPGQSSCAVTSRRPTRMAETVLVLASALILPSLFGQTATNPLSGIYGGLSDEAGNPVAGAVVREGGHRKEWNEVLDHWKRRQTAAADSTWKRGG